MGRNWDENEDNILKQMVATHGKQWNLIAGSLPRRTPSQVAARWEKCLDPTITKGPFTAEEDQLILEYVAQNGPRSWPRIASILPHRSSKQCRERWFNHLDPTVTKVSWGPEEDNFIFAQHKAMGPKWSSISKHLPGRTDNAVKNRFNSSISKRIQVDANGNEYLAPDASRRTYKSVSKISKERPPPLVPPTQAVPVTQNRLAPPPPLQLGEIDTTSPGSMTPFTPFALPTPTFPHYDFGLTTPISPMAGFQMTPSVMPGLGSPSGQQSAYGFFSPGSFKTDDAETFK
jgi:hypothetical protein